jgi:hypothetical protein
VQHHRGDGGRAVGVGYEFRPGHGVCVYLRDLFTFHRIQTNFLLKKRNVCVRRDTYHQWYIRVVSESG